MGRYGFPRDNRLLSKVVVGLFVGYAVVSIIDGVLMALEIPYLKTEKGIEEWETGEWNTLDFLMMGNAIVALVVFVGLVVAFCFWMNRSCKNAWLLAPERMSMTPGWSVGYYFIPIVNLWRPYQGMREVRDASCPAGALASTLPAWWTLWIIVNLVENVSWRLAMRAESIEDYTLTSKIDLAILPVDLVLVVLIIGIVRRITSDQTARLQALPAPDPMRMPPPQL